ncbi:L-ornithine 5-monooxygenase [Xylariomycetidae sp. FL0641]|nr:L-ornithine 5-monooxygenase [Xylariomycetidae sp. FL0641]
MAPHSLADSLADSHDADSSYDGPASPSWGNGVGRLSNGTSPGARSHLRRTSPTEVHDLICVGFGPASLAIAIALHDSIAAGGPGRAAHEPSPKVLFLEKQREFAWHAGMLLPGAKMQISFIKDMATLRDPTSKFTFLNYLHENGRLVEFTNLGTFLPARVEYQDYLRWCAGFFDDVVSYGSEVVSVSPVPSSDPSEPTSMFSVTSRNFKTGNTTTYQAKNVLLAIGGQPSIPKCLPAPHPRVIHSSQYAHLVPKILNNPNAPYRVAVVGAGQSAAEIFNNVQTLYPNSRTSLIMRSEFLKPSDDSPFVNSIFNPSYVDSLYTRSPELRQHLLSDAKATNYGVVRLELIERLYELMYDQRRDLGPDEQKWPHRILGATEITHFEDLGEQLRLMVRPLTGPAASDNDSAARLSNGSGPDARGETLEADLVIAATGYQRRSHLDMMGEIADLLPEADSPKANPASASIQGRPLKVLRDYSVQFAPGKVAPGSGVWLQGCCEGTHGLSDTLLSILATRSGEIVNSIFGS